MGGLALLVALSCLANIGTTQAVGSPQEPYPATNFTYDFRLPVVQSPPKITMAPKSTKVAEEGTVSFFCRASGNPAPTFHWEKGGKRINPSRNRYELNDAPHVSALRIKPVKAGKDNATYTCVANNGLGEARADATLKIYAKEEDTGIASWVVRYKDLPAGFPKIEVNPKLKSVEKDKQISLNCEVSGDPTPTVLWLKDNLPVDTTDPRVSVSETGTLIIEHAQESDEGTFECVAENEFGSTYSYRAMLYIRVRRVSPKFSGAPSDVRIPPGNDVNLTCVAVGSPMPYVKWRSGAQDLTGEDHIPIGRNTLILTDVRMSKNYTCEASSDLGNIEHHVQVIVEAAPDPPKGIRVLEVTASTVKLMWDTDTSPEPARSYTIEYRNQSRSKFDQFRTNIRTNVYTVTALKAHTAYSFQVVAENLVGRSRPSKMVEVTTGELAPGTAPENVVAKAISPTSIMVSWDEPKIPNGVIMGYKIFYTLKPNDPIFFWEQLEIKQDKRVYTIDNLVPNATYTVCLLAFSSVGQGPMSYPVQVLTTQGDKGTTYEFRVSAKNEVDYGDRAVTTLITPDGAPSGAPQNFTATGLTETSVRLTWDLPARNLRNGDIVMYQIAYHKLSEPTREEDLNCTDAFIDIVSLDMNTDYIFKIKAYTTRGAGPWSNKLHFRTFGKMPPPPKNVKVRRTSDSTLEVRWDDTEALVSGYKIYYNLFATPAMYAWQQKEIGPYTVADITGVEAHSVYAVRVQAKSVDGRYGNMSEVVTTDVKETQREDAVQKFRASSVLSKEVTLQWEKPKLGDVSKYILNYTGFKSYREDNNRITSDDSKDITIAGHLNTFTVENLKPKMKYEFNISAIFASSKTRGSVQHLVTETLIDVPPPLERPEPISISRGHPVLKLKRASEKNGPISHYHIVVVPKVGPLRSTFDYTIEQLTKDKPDNDQPYIAARFDSQSLPSEFTLGNGQEYGSFMNKPLSKDKNYQVFLRAYSVDNRLSTSSDFSVPVTINSTPQGPNPPSGPTNSDAVPVNKADEADTNALLTIVTPTCAGAVIVILICALICFLFMRKKNKSKGDLMEPESKALMIEPAPFSIDPVEMRRQHYQTPAMISHPPIPIERLSEHMDSLKASDNFKFSQEYESIEPGQQFTWDNSNLEVNKPKNRYANVIAYDHSRVILQPMEGVPGSDYINANYMDGYRKQNAYIATQGPLPETFGDFWRMVWEQRSATIVMMTKLEERSRIKCDQYWPSRGAETYGLMHIQLVDVTELATYTIRTFHMSRYGISEKREVRQFQFTAWPDHGVPDHPTPLLMFMRRVKASNPPDAGSIIVHCSAGVGRTGAFIVIDAMLERIKHEMTVDIYGHVTCLRAQRNYMVQTEDQYIFIHDALLEAVQCGNTEVPARNLAAHIQKLTAPEPGQAITGMELEFKRLANVKASPNRFVSANLAVNKFKNRLVNILPYETTRVCLQPIRGVDGSDYINASFIDGYRYKKAYIATQGPLAETTEDFWRMLWEHNSTIIVMLTKLREMGREKCHQYWPSERSARYQYFVVDPMTEYNMPQYILREFKVTDARDGQSRTIRQFQFTDWPEQGVPKSGEGFIDFIGQVHKTKEQFGQEGPISVHCSAGVGRTGVFITLSIVLERMRYEGVVDMFQTVKMLRTQRPAMVQTEDQFQFCYRAALEYLGSFDHYAN
ncbi:receptor-type tyrosine-protein phosphatase S-like isoform X12 [Physella acuta]|uniref:receptor-type tyrosine-protein phosphatase S-like isoform X12 n=1 Tax=Physella acuta TaxID=109671 RepID=UPI0027DD1B95|nr:receptor-type tyrosine-protein phosphatase S-like isoform X12 [Physella acuta]